MENEQISALLQNFAEQIERAPVHLVGASVSVTGGQGGSATGLRVEVSAGPSGTHTTGMSVTVDSAKYAEEASALISDIRSAASYAKTAKPDQGWIKGLLSRATALGNRALDPIISGATAALVKHYSGL